MIDNIIYYANGSSTEIGKKAIIFKTIILLLILSSDTISENVLFRLEMSLVSNGNNLKSSEDLGVAYVELDAQYNAEKRLLRCKSVKFCFLFSLSLSLVFKLFI